MSGSSLGSCAMSYPIVSQDNYNHFPADYVTFQNYSNRLDGYIYGPPTGPPQPVASTAQVAVISPVFGGVNIRSPSFPGAGTSAYSTMMQAYGNFPSTCGMNYQSLWK